MSNTQAAAVALKAAQSSAPASSLHEQGRAGASSAPTGQQKPPARARQSLLSRHAQPPAASEAAAAAPPNQQSSASEAAAAATASGAHSSMPAETRLEPIAELAEEVSLQELPQPMYSTAHPAHMPASVNDATARRQATDSMSVPSALADSVAHVRQSHAAAADGSVLGLSPSMHKSSTKRFHRSHSTTGQQGRPEVAPLLQSAAVGQQQEALSTSANPIAPLLLQQPVVVNTAHDTAAQPSSSSSDAQTAAAHRSHHQQPHLHKHLQQQQQQQQQQSPDSSRHQQADAAAQEWGSGGVVGMASASRQQQPHHSPKHQQDSTAAHRSSREGVRQPPEQTAGPAAVDAVQLQGLQAALVQTLTASVEGAMSQMRSVAGHSPVVSCTAWQQIACPQV